MANHFISVIFLPSGSRSVKSLLKYRSRIFVLRGKCRLAQAFFKPIENNSLSIFVGHNEPLGSGSVRCSCPEKCVGTISIVIESRDQKCELIDSVHFTRHLVVERIQCANEFSLIRSRFIVLFRAICAKGGNLFTFCVNHFIEQRNRCKFNIIPSKFVYDFAELRKYLLQS